MKDKATDRSHLRPGPSLSIMIVRDSSGNYIPQIVGDIRPVVRREDMVRFSTLHRDGTESDVRTINQSDISACPHVIMVAEHYRTDGSCKCDDPTERAMMIREWEYTEADF